MSGSGSSTCLALVSLDIWLQWVHMSCSGGSRCLALLRFDYSEAQTSGSSEFQQNVTSTTFAMKPEKFWKASTPTSYWPQTIPGLNHLAKQCVSQSSDGPSCMHEIYSILVTRAQLHDEAWYCQDASCMVGDLQTSRPACLFFFLVLQLCPACCASQRETVWWAKSNFLGLLPKWGNDQWDCEIGNYYVALLTTVKFVYCSRIHAFGAWTSIHIWHDDVAPYCFPNCETRVVPAIKVGWYYRCLTNEQPYYVQTLIYQKVLHAIQILA